MIPLFLFLIFLSMTADPLKAAENDNKIDENVDPSEAISKANADIKTPLVFGDIAPNRKRNAVPCTATGCKWPKHGSYVYIPVYISHKYSTAERNLIIRSLVSFHKPTCIRFVWWNNHRDYLYFYDGSGCWSYLGRQGGQQLVSLKKNGCMYLSTVQHEVNHALGFHHEQVRSDRDKYIQILTQNIIAGKEHNFVKVETNNLGTPYDFNSVMHYSKYAFTRNGQPTIISKENPSADLGIATTLSENDIARINKLYQC
ncbi:high choriolytic enzyme 1 [Fundulus heteroclitus]|uniref:high choriolytic enzyme 1 n=1 Tax=Fundulus heteroclitus TaxID=8078 RepID=UPI00165AED4B|nr:high choriolytic enzyme 1 [Fundulus heteroclitus]